MVTRTPRPRREGRVLALAARRKECAELCAAVVAAPVSDATKRVALNELVRYATPKGVQRPGDLRTPGVAALDNDPTATATVHHEHVVPVRVLVDRMLRGGSPAAVLKASVVAHVLASEHAAIGPLVQRHGALYAAMLTPPSGT